MSDRELLEMAAKAAGIAGMYAESHQAHGDLPIRGIDTGKPVWWCPLDDDGDSRWLQIALDMDMCIMDELYPYSVYCLAVCPYSYNVYGCQEPYTDDMDLAEKLAACRLAVLRTAAAIGEGMP